ncbi:MAG TPA: class I SAM-dependent methyltransferase [Nonomuraea sp.]|nr:class I SAM-dependent methyltransferase [Nonomuraea sp.]
MPTLRERFRRGPSEGPVDVSRDLARIQRAKMQPGEAETERIVDARRQQLSASTETVGNTVDKTGESYSVRVADESRSASADSGKALLLSRLAGRFAPGTVVELGSAFGISGAHFVAGLQAGGGGTFITMDAVPARSALAAETIALINAPQVDVQMVVGMFEDNFDAWQGAHVVYIDGNHWRAPTLEYVETALERCDPGVLLLLDDIHGYSEEMDQTWLALKADKRFAFAGRIGSLGVLGRGPAERLKG